MNKAISVTSKRDTFIKPLDQHIRSIVQGHLYSLNLFWMVDSSCQGQNKLFFNLISLLPTS